MLKNWMAPKAGARDRLTVDETLYRLNNWQKAFLVFLCAVAMILFVGPTFTSNVLPHYKLIFNSDGSLNPGEASSSVLLSGAVVGLIIIPMLLRMQFGWFQKFGMVLTAGIIVVITITNGCGTQGRARELRNSAPREKVDRIARLEAEITSAEKAFKQVPEHKYVMAPTVKVAEKALENLKESAAKECETGLTKWKRGPNCKDLTNKRDTKAEEVQRLQDNADLTERAMTIEVEIARLKRQRADEGSAPEHVDAEMEVFTGFLSAMGIITPAQGLALSDNKPVMETACMELMAFFLTSPTIMALFSLADMMASSQSEAHRRMIEVTQAVVAADAKVALGTTGGRAGLAAALDTTAPEAVLEIEGRDMPAFAEAPETVAEAAAAALLKADPDKKLERKARKRKAPSRDSVVLWFKECCLFRDGRNTDSKVARANYETWCEKMNLEPVGPTTFGRALREECGISGKKSGGTIRYQNMGLRPDLRVISG